MAVTILEALTNANYNLKTGYKFTISLAKDQLNNALILLEKGYELNDLVEPLLEKYGSVNEVPENPNKKEGDRNNKI